MPEAAMRAQIAAHLATLCATIGARPGGSSANAAAADYIHATFAAAGYALERIEFGCPAWRVDETTVTLGGRVLEAAANSFSAPCDVSAPLVRVGTLAQLQDAELAGRIALFYGELSAAPYAPQSWFLFSDKERQILDLLRRKRPAAILTIQPRPDTLERIFEDHEFEIPSATVAAQDGLALLAAAPEPALVRIATTHSAGHTWDIIARSGPASGPRLSFCAHYDTKFDTPGALDNGSGVVTLLALAERLRAASLPVALELIAFGNEEHMPEGTGFYLEKYGHTLDDVIALVNLDGPGHALDNDTIMTMAASDDLRAAADALLPLAPDLIWTEPWYESNHSLFAFRGVPCLAFTSPATRHLLHRTSDSLQWVNPDRLGLLVEYLAVLAAELAGRTPAWARPAAPA